MRETLVLDVPHRQIVFTIPRMLRVFFKYKRRLLGDICRSALRSLARCFEIRLQCPQPYEVKIKGEGAMSDEMSRITWKNTKA